MRTRLTLLLALTEESSDTQFDGARLVTLHLLLLLAVAGSDPSSC